MTDFEPIDDEALLERFRNWLREARAEAGSFLGDPGEPIPGPEVGLYRLVEEFTALRHEVKLETKGSRGLQEQIETLLPAIRQAVDQFRSVVPREEQAASSVGKPLAEAIANLDEALARGRLEIEKARDRLIAEATAAAAAIESDLDTLYRGQSWFHRLGLEAYHMQVREVIARRIGEPRTGLFDALLEGYSLIQNRLRRSMDTGQVRRIETVGQAVDPALMTVIEVIDQPDQSPGHVVDEVRRGYTWRGRVLRYAEVRAARERRIETRLSELENSSEDAEEPEPEPGLD